MQGPEKCFEDEYDIITITELNQIKETYFHVKEYKYNQVLKKVIKEINSLTINEFKESKNKYGFTTVDNNLCLYCLPDAQIVTEINNEENIEKLIYGLNPSNQSRSQKSKSIIEGHFYETKVNIFFELSGDEIIRFPRVLYYFNSNVRMKIEGLYQFLCDKEPKKDKLGGFNELDDVFFTKNQIFFRENAICEISNLLDENFTFPDCSKELKIEENSLCFLETKLKFLSSDEWEKRILKTEEDRKIINSNDGKNNDEKGETPQKIKEKKKDIGGLQNFVSHGKRFMSFIKDLINVDKDVKKIYLIYVYNSKKQFNYDVQLQQNFKAVYKSLENSPKYEFKLVYMSSKDLDFHLYDKVLESHNRMSNAINELKKENAEIKKENAERKKENEEIKKKNEEIIKINKLLNDKIDDFKEKMDKMANELMNLKKKNNPQNSNGNEIIGNQIDEEAKFLKKKRKLSK